MSEATWLVTAGPSAAFAAASFQLAQGISRGAVSTCFSTRTSFQSSGFRAKAKPDLRASPIMDSLERRGIAEQPPGAQGSGAALQIAHQRLANALTLPAVIDRHSEFEAVIGGMESVAGLADHGLEAVDHDRRDYAEFVAFADMDEMIEHVAR